MTGGRTGFRWAAKAQAATAFSLAGALVGAGLYFGNLSYVTTSDDAARAAAVASREARVTREHAAADLSELLAQSTTDRAAIDNAYNDVDSCGPDLKADPRDFTNAAASRRALLAALSTLPGRAALPPGLLSDLSNAWEVSIAADDGFATWAHDEITQGCVPDDTSDPGYQATITPDNEATTYKTAFTLLWDPIAAQYGLPQYQWPQL
jgi:hypothetical protein